VHSDYGVAWHDLRKRRIIFGIVFLTYLPGVLAIMFTVVPVLSWLTGAKPDYFFYAIAACWMAAFAVAGFRVSHFPCPRCGNAFFAKWWFNNPLARKCVHCGLPIGANSGMGQP
jgi:predicted RNA-binding Zn-ribbon protein involved in translation (DUF1610 family)